MRVPSLSPLRATLAVVVVMGLGCGAAVAARPAVPAEPAATVRPVEAAVLACPRPGTGSVTGSRISMVTLGATEAEAPVASADPASTGRAELSRLKVGSTPLVSLTSAPAVGTIEVAQGRRTHPLIARAEGALAPSFAAGQVTRVTGGRGRGLMATSCAAPSADAWFVGGGGAVGRRTTVWLTNTDSTAAVVDLDIFGPDGRVETPGAIGVEVAPHSQQSLRLDVLTPGLKRAALHVVTRAGRVAAAVTDVDTVGLIPRGADFVPASAAPSTTVVVPGVLGGSEGRRVLQVASPGDTDAIVDVRIVADDGTFAPESAALIEIPAGSVASVDLAKYLDGSTAAAVLLSSDVPVVAGLRTVLPLGGNRAETTYTAGTLPVSGAAAFGPVNVDEAHGASLMLTAPSGPAVVAVTVVPPVGGELRTTEVAVPAGTTFRYALPAMPAGSAVVVTVVEVAPAPAATGPDAAAGGGADDPSGADAGGAALIAPSGVTAALQLRWTRPDGVLVSTVPMTSGTATVVVPPARPDPAAGVRG